MSTQKNKSTGRWDCCFRVRKSDGSLSKTWKRGFKTKAEAQQYEASHRHEAAEASSATFMVLFEAMTVACQASEVTSEQRRTRIQRYCAAIASRPMKDLSKTDFLAWREALASCDLSTTTKNDIIRLVKQIGRFAWNTYDIPDNTKVMQPFKKELDDYTEMVIINYHQFRKLVEAEPDELMRIFFQTLFMTGMRKGEARALQKSDYDPIRKRVHVYKAMRRDEDSIKTTKTGQSRWIPLDDDTDRKLRMLAERPGPYLFGDFLPLSNNMITRHFKSDLEAAKLPDMRIHDLRHSHVSLLWANGVPIPEIAKRLGHSSPKTTMQAYAHIFDVGQNASLSVLNSLVSPQ